MIALEALAAGVPVVASAVGGLRELAGIARVRPDDPAALATAIERTLAQPPARVDMTPFDWPAVTARLHRHLLGAPAGPGRKRDDVGPGCESYDSTGRRTA
jgi:glycosyltransferase involved in cell wall biosynthesis